MERDHREVARPASETQDLQSGSCTPGHGG